MKPRFRWRADRSPDGRVASRWFLMDHECDPPRQAGTLELERQPMTNALKWLAQVGTEKERFNEREPAKRWVVCEAAELALGVGNE